MMEYNRPKVGVGVIIVKDGKVLLGKRKGAHGAGTWSFPGGHLEFNESIAACARREVKEEVGVSIANIRKLSYTNDINHKEGVHYITCYVQADYASGKPKVMEPDKCEKWDWFEWGNLPKPHFLSIKNLLKDDFDPTK